MKKAFGLVVALSAAPAFGATVNWDPAAAQITGTEVVNTSGTLFASENTGGAAATFAGVNFGADANNVNYTLGNLPSRGNPPFSSAHPVAGADAILADGGYNGPGAGTFSLDLTNLTPGNTYTVQLFMIDDRGCCSERTAAVVGGPSGQDYSTENGIVFTGSFLADATTQTINGLIDADPQNGYTNLAQLNAFQVREVIPEPASLGLLAVSAAGLLARRRRRA